MPHDAGVEAPAVVFGLGDDFYGFGLGGAGDGAGRKQAEDDVAQVCGVVFGQGAAYLGAGLEDGALIGLQAVYIAVGGHFDVFRNHAEVVAYQVDDGGVLGCLFGVLHQELFRIGQGSVDGAFHGEGLYLALLYADKDFGGEADEPVFQPQLVQGFGVEEYFFQCQIGGDGYPASEVRQVAVACQQVLLHEVERMSVCGGGRGSDVPLDRAGASGGCASGKGCCSRPRVACLRELEKAGGGVYPVEGLDVRLLLRVVYDEEEGHIGSGQCVHAGDGFCPAVRLHASIDCGGYHLDYQNEEHHGNGIYRGIGHARYVAVRHGVGGGKAGRTGHAAGDGAQQVENVYLEHEQAYAYCHQHGHQRDGGAYAEQEPAAFLERGHQIPSCRCPYFGKEEQQSQLAQQLVGRAGHGPQNGAGLSDGAQEQGDHQDASRQSRRERQTVREGDVELAEEHAQHDAQGDGEEVGVGQLLGVVAQQACHSLDAVLLAHHHQLVAEFQGEVGRGGEVDAASADAGDGAAEVLHQVEVAQLLVYHILLGEQQGFNLLHVYEWQFAFFAFAHEDGELV